MMTLRFTLYVVLTLAVCLTAATLRMGATPALQIDLYAAHTLSDAAREAAVRDATSAAGHAVSISLTEIPQGLRLRVFTADGAAGRSVAGAVRTNLEHAGLLPRLAVESRASGGAAVYVATAVAATLLSGLVMMLLAAAIRATAALMREEGAPRGRAASAST